MDCTFIGLGNLGKELCGRIGLAGFPTFAYDLNPDASKKTAEQEFNYIATGKPEMPVGGQKRMLAEKKRNSKAY